MILRRLFCLEVFASVVAVFDGGPQVVGFRVLRTFLELQNEWAEGWGRTSTASWIPKGMRLLVVRLYGGLVRAAHVRLTCYLRSRFEQLYF